MNVTSLSIPDVKLIEPAVYGDDRGFFMETWSAASFIEAGIDVAFLQDNFSRSGKGILRGLHYQIQHPQGKLVRCTRGEVFDVVVDLRRSSPFFGKWLSVVLSEKNRLAMWVPPGFAHGFVVTSESADFQYKYSDIYAPTYERTIQWNDTDLNISWPVAEVGTPVVSDKDASGVPFASAEVFE